MAIERKDIAAIREDYTLASLSENEVHSDPIQQFVTWFDQARNAQVIEPNAMALSTIDSEGFPSSRIVLLKDVTQDGLSFFTNYDSHKGTDIKSNNRVSLLFFWPELQRQVRVDGLAEKLSPQDSDDYFASRPRGSQIGAWSSPQSKVITDRDFLEAAVLKHEQRLAGQNDISRPPFWGGYLVRPHYVEFWQGRASRLHDRISYRKDNMHWDIKRLAP